MAKIKPSNNEAQMQLEQAVGILQEHGKEITIDQFTRIVTSIRVRYVFACVTALTALAVSAFGLGVKWPSNSASDQVPLRVSLEGSIDFNATYAHTDTSKWVVAIQKYLASKGHLVTRIDTKPFDSWLAGFRLRVEPNIGNSVTGLAFRVQPGKSGPLFQPLSLRQTESSMEVAVPPCDKDDHLLLILRLEKPPGQQQIQLNRSVNLRVI